MFQEKKEDDLQALRIVQIQRFWDTENMQK